MGIRDGRREELSRLECKTLDSQFKTTIRDGLSCSPFEAEAVLQVVHEVYGAALGRSDSGVLPGQVTLVAVDAEEPAGKPVAVANYVSTFTRCAQLAKENMQAGQIAFLLRRGRALIQLYLELLEECRQDKNLGYHLEELWRIGQAGAPKKGLKETCR